MLLWNEEGHIQTRLMRFPEQYCAVCFLKHQKNYCTIEKLQMLFLNKDNFLLLMLTSAVPVQGCTGVQE